MSNPNLTDKTVIEGIRRRDGRITKRFKRRTYSYVRSLTFVDGKKVYSAYDLYADGMQVLYKKLDNPAFVLTCSLDYYFQSICKYTLINILNKKKKEGPETDTEDIFDLSERDHPVDEGIGEEVTGELKYTLIRKNLEKMMEACQTVIGFLLDNLTNAQIAERMKRSYFAVAKLKTKCIKKLRKLIFNDPEYKDFSE